MACTTGSVYDLQYVHCDSMSGMHVCAQDSVYVKFVSEAAAGQGYKALHGWMYDGMNSLHFLPRTIHYVLNFC